MNISRVLSTIRNRLWPQTLASQLIVLLLIAIVVSQLVSVIIFRDERRIALVALARDNMLARAAAIAELLDETPPLLQDKILSATSSRFAAFWIGATPVAPLPGTSNVEQRLEGYLRRQVPSGREVHLNIFADEKRGPDARGNEGDGDDRSWRDVPRRERPAHLNRIMNNPEDLALSISLPDGRWLNVATSYRPPPGAFVPLLVQLALSAVLIVLVVAIAVRYATRPLKDLAAAAEKLGRGEEIPLLAPMGPLEVRSVTTAFNEMQDRLTRFVKDRTRMLAAISHDLRTPITSLRLRAEFIDDEENREKIIETLEEMAHMTEAALSFAKDEARTEPAERTDLSALLASLVDDQQDLGHQASMEPGERIVLSCRPNALKRAFRNLIENGIRYAGAVDVTARKDGADIVVSVKDKGPGIPNERLDDVFEPFVRLEESRSEETGGIGLGLAITRSIVHAHGGTIALRNRPEGGLEAEVRLPAGD